MDSLRKNYINQFHRFQYNRELAFAPKFFKALRTQYQQFLINYKLHRNTTHALMAINSIPIQAVLKPLYIDAGINYGSLVYSQLPKVPKKIKRRAPLGFNQEMIDLINSYFEGDILNTSEGITDTTRNLIRVVMQIATEEGRDLDWIEQQLTIESYDLTRNRSRLIARTETVTATNRAAWFAAAKTGLKMNKEWLSASDNRVRPDHIAVNGNTTDFEGFFNVGGSMMLIPGAKVQENGLETPAKEVCNCRCVCLYIPIRENGRLIEWDYGVWPVMVY